MFIHEYSWTLAGIVPNMSNISRQVSTSSSKIQTIDLFFVELHVYTYTQLYTYHMYIYIYSSHVFLRYRGLNLWKDTLYIWFDAKRNNVFPLDCSFKPSEFGWFQVWTVSPGFVGEEHNHCYWFPHKQCHFMWMFPFFRPNLIDKTLLFAKTISNPCFDWLNPTPAFLLSSK